MITQPGGDPRPPRARDLVIGVVGILLIFSLILAWMLAGPFVWALGVMRKPIPLTACADGECGPVVPVRVRHWFSWRIELRCFACRRVLDQVEAATAYVRWN